MPKIHPHAEASYRVVGLDGGFFGVEVSIAGSYPTLVSRFDTEVGAEKWIAEHRRQVESQTQSGRWFTRSDGRRRSHMH
jgi:hypothetical protein